MFPYLDAFYRIQFAVCSIGLGDITSSSGPSTHASVPDTIVSGLHREMHIVVEYQRSLNLSSIRPLTRQEFSSISTADV